MTIEQIDNSKVLIVLGKEDMKNYSLEYKTMSFENPHSGKALRQIMILACSKTGISIADKKIIIEAIPHCEGCLILLTLKSQKRGKVYRIKMPVKGMCCVLETTEAMIQTVIALSKIQPVPDNNIYFYNDRYYIIMNTPFVPPAVSATLREFSHHIICNTIAIARIRENGLLISKGKAHNNVAKHFLKTS